MSDSTRGYLHIHRIGYLQIHSKEYLKMHSRGYLQIHSRGYICSKEEENLVTNTSEKQAKPPKKLRKAEREASGTSAETRFFVFMLKYQQKCLQIQ